MSFWNKIENPAFDPLPPAQPHAAPSPPPAAREPEPAPSLRHPAEPIRGGDERAASPAGAPVAGSAVPVRSSDLRLGRGVWLEGKLTFSGTVRIDATFQGSIVTDGVLVVGEGAKVDADIACGTIVVEGEVNGNVKAKEAVELHRSATLRGEVETPSLAVERGALFEGTSRRPAGTASASAGKAAAAPAPSAS